MKINPVFTNFIATDIIQLNNEHIKDVCYEIRNKDPGRQISNEGGWQSNNVNLQTVLPELYKEIKNRLDDLHYYFEFKDNLIQKITDTWININKKHDFNTVHDHGGGMFTGIYYVNAGQNMGNVEFLTPIAAHTFCFNGTMVKNSNPFNSNIQKVFPQTGMLVIFPSWLFHYTRPNYTDEDRISISFNSHVN
jgi:hypothetical protein